MIVAAHNKLIENPYFTGTTLNGYELFEIPANKFPIGVFLGEEILPFTNHEFQLHKGDTIYAFSDGYADQFGGPNSKKFMTRRFKSLLLEIQELSLMKQKEILDKAAEEWRGMEEQVDDILIIGVRV